MKNIIILIAVLSVVSCTTINGEESNNNKELVKQYFTYFNSHEWAKMAEMYSENAEFKDPSLGQGIIKQTHLQIIEKYTELNGIFPDIKDEVIKTYPSGKNHIIVEFVSSGTAPDNSKFELPICAIFTIENGKITQDFSYFDNFEE
jgi:ketosteroid isomerase-like protein